MVLTLSASTIYNLGAPVSATVTIHDTPFNVWRLAEFGTNANNSAISGDFADPDDDGIANLLEYALHLDPNVADVTGLPVPQNRSDLRMSNADLHQGRFRDGHPLYTRSCLRSRRAVEH